RQVALVAGAQPFARLGPPVGALLAHPPDGLAPGLRRRRDRAGAAPLRLPPARGGPALAALPAGGSGIRGDLLVRVDLGRSLAPAPQQPHADEPSAARQPGPGGEACRAQGSASIWSSAVRAWPAVSGSTVMWLTTWPAASDSSERTRCGRSIRFIVEQ